MGFWSWFGDRIDHFIHDPTDNVNNGLIANPFLVKETPDGNHYLIGGEFGEDDGILQLTSTEFWTGPADSLVHVGIKPPEQELPSFALAGTPQWPAAYGSARPNPPQSFRELNGIRWAK